MNALERSESKQLSSPGSHSASAKKSGADAPSAGSSPMSVEKLPQPAGGAGPSVALAANPGEPAGLPVPKALGGAPAPAPAKEKVTAHCELCLEPRQNTKVPLCKMHRRAKDNLTNQRQHILRRHGEDSEEYRLYTEMWTNGSSVSRNKAILQYHRLFGSCNKPPGARKAEFSFVQFAHTIKTKASA